MTFDVAANGRHALVVDDNLRHAAINATVLEASGWTVDVALDGFEAIVRFRAREYDLLVLDYRLPGMDGVDVLNWAHRNLPVVPDVIVVSSECPNLLQTRFARLGVRAILSKPATAADLVRALAA
jgi:CheY-like chemotaxis protein